MQSNEESKKGKKKGVEGRKYIQIEFENFRSRKKTQKITKVNKKATTN